MKNVAVLTSGGDAPGMNAVVRSVVRCGLGAGLKVFGIRRGYQGLLEGRFEEMDHRSVSGLLGIGGSVLECARCREMTEPHGPEAAARILKRREIDGLIAIGGDGTFRGARDLSNYGVNVVAVTGTIDNDIPGTDHTIGYDTACDTLLWCLNQLRDTAASHNRTFVVEAMGRNSGWLALSAGLAGGADVILIPEVPWTREDVLATIMRRLETGRSFSLVVIAEGAGRATDLAGWLNEQTDMEHEVKTCIPGHIQRGGAPTTFDRLLATRCGAQALEALLAGHKNVMIGDQAGAIVEVPLDDAVGSTRTIDRGLYDLAMRVA
jgi:6-phosphofructokinase 1